MKRFWKAVLTAASATIVAAVSAAGVSASGMITPGHFTTDSADGNAYWYSALYAQVSVNRNTFIFRPSHNGRPASISHATLLYVTLQTGNISGSDCFVIPDSDFVQGPGLQSVTLNAYVDSSNLCYGLATTLDAALTGAGCGKGCPPPPPLDIPLPMSISITWTGNGVTSTSAQAGHSTCAGLTTTFQFSSTLVYGAASGTLSFHDGVTAPIVLPVSDFANVDKGSLQSDSEGTVDPRCFGE